MANIMANMGGGNKFLQNNNFYDIIEYGYNKDYKKGRG